MTKTKVERVIDKSIANIRGLDPASTTRAVERASIEAALADKKTACKLMNWPPSRGPMPKCMRKKPRVVAAKIGVEMLPVETPPLVTRRDKTNEFHCDVHVETLASLSLWQADHVVTAYDEGGLGGILLGDKDDFLPRRNRCTGCCGPRTGKRAKPRVPPTVVVDLCYPLLRVARVTIPPFRWRGPTQSWGAILWSIARAYKQIYKRWKRWGVWGHAISNLWIEGVAATPDGRLVVHIGS